MACLLILPGLTPLAAITAHERVGDGKEGYSLGRLRRFRRCIVGFGWVLLLDHWMGILQRHRLVRFRQGRYGLDRRALSCPGSSRCIYPSEVVYI